MNDRKSSGYLVNKNPTFFSQSFTEKNCDETQPQPIKLLGYPPRMEDCYKLLQASGAKSFALFGGAIRDADYAARHNQACPIKDYDLRVWLPTTDYEQHLREFLKSLASITSIAIHEEKSIGTNKIRYCLSYNDAELDISIRPIPNTFQTIPVPTEAVAINRASDSDIGLCSVAIDPC